MDTFLNILGLAVLVVGATWLVRWIASALRGPRGEGAPPEEVLEEARQAALKFESDEISLERLDGNRTFRQHAERLSKPDVPFKEVAQLAQSPTSSIAALGLSAIAKRDDVPEKWPDDAIRSLPNAPFLVEPFIYRALPEKARQG
jgi:hypothetical protein